MIDWTDPTSLRDARKARRIEVDELAAEAKVSVSTIYRIEQGRFDPRLKTQLALDTALETLSAKPSGQASAA